MNSVREHIISELSKINVHNVVIIDWGSGSWQKRAERWIKDKDCEIINIDIEPINHPTVVADICKPLMIKEADIAFCMQTLEHCYDFDVALDNIYNNLKINGKLYISVPYVAVVHGKADYWRFTKLGIKTILERHKFKITSIVQMKYGTPIGYFVEAIK